MTESEFVREALYKYFSSESFGEELVKEISYRVDGLENREKGVVACILYILDKGLNNLINEEDDCKIWDYLE